MNRLFALLFWLLFLSSAFAQEVIFVSPDWPNSSQPEVLESTSYWVSSLALYAVREQSVIRWVENNDFSWLFVVMNDLVDAVSFSVVDELPFRNNKESFLNDYLRTLRQILQQSTLLHQDILDDLSGYNAERLLCIDQKRLADNAFVFGFTNNDALELEQSIQDAIQAEYCIVENRIRINAYRAIEARLWYYISLWEQKHTLLFENFETILEYHPVLDQELLRSLQELTSRINQS